MEPKTLLLFNATVTVIIAISTDYWILVTYDEVTVLPPNCTMSIAGKAYKVLSCGNNETGILLEQWSSTIRQCNDLPARHRNAVRQLNLIYDDSCESIVQSSPWRFDGANSLLDNIGFGCTICTLLCFALALVNNHKIDGNPTLTAWTMLLAGVFLTTALLTTAANIYLIRRHVPKTRVDTLVKELQNTNPCWSFAVGLIALALIFTCAYLNVASHKSRRVKQRSQRRRRQLQTAIMSSCQQEIALAIRAKMTVI